MNYITIENLVLSIPMLAMVLIWINNSFKDKKMNYWLILIVANLMWIGYCTYMIKSTNDDKVTSGMSMIIIDNIVCIVIAVSGILRLKKLNNKVNTTISKEKINT